MDDQVDIKEVTLIPNTNVISVATKIENALGTSRRQFIEDGYPRIFNDCAPEIPDTPLRQLDRLLFKTVIERPNALGQGDVIDKRLKRIDDDLSKVILTPEGRVLVEATLSAFEKFRQITDQFRGGGSDSILHEGENTESKEIEIDGKHLTKYQKYWDYAPGRFGQQRAYDANNGLPRETEVHNDFRIAMEHKEAELRKKLTSPDVTEEDLSNFLATLFLQQFAEVSRWTERGSPVPREL